MSTSANLPAGFLITTLNGKRCTAVPRSLTTITGLSTTSTSVKSSTTTLSSTTTETTASSTPAQRLPSVSSSAAAAAVVPVITSSSTTIQNEPQIPTTSQIIQPSSSTTVLAITTSAASAELITPSPIPQDSTPIIPQDSTPTIPQDSTPIEPTATSTSTSSTQSDVGRVPPDPFNNQNGFPSATGSSSSLFPSPTSNPIAGGEATTSDSVSRSQVSPGPVVGGVMGGLALVGLVGFLFWLFKRRRRYRRDSLLTPLDGERGSFSGADHEYTSDEKLMSRFGAQFGYQTDKIRDLSASITAGIAGFGASLKSKVVHHNSDTPTVNLNRGNSQFLDGPIPQHSRNNSVLSDRSSDHSVKDRFHHWWERVVDSVGFNRILWRSRLPRGVFSEEQARRSDTPDFSQFIRINERDLQLQTGGQPSISSADNGLESSAPNLGNFGLSLESNNPFVDPIPALASTQKQKNNNPFMDPIPEPQPPPQNKNTYIADVRRSRGQPTMATKTNQARSRSSSASRRHSRYPSTIGLNRDSYRDTMFSSLSANGRKGKGRSDPFDLERPELWMSYNANKLANANASQNHGRASSRPSVRASSVVFPDPLRMSSVQGNMVGQMDNHQRQPSTAHSRTISNDFGSIYSSGVSSLAGWAGPGPDLGPGSSNTSLRGNANSDGDSLNRSDLGGAADGQGGGVVKGSFPEIDLSMVTQRDMNNVSPLSIEGNWDSRRATDNSSPVSFASKSSRSVGKAI